MGMARIMNMGKYNYWERLDRIKMLSISRRLERYRIIYTRKILHGDSLNCGLVWKYTQDKGHIFKVNYSPNSAPTRVKTVRLNSYQVQGPVMFNALPRYLRDSDESEENWKKSLDKYLETLPDKPVLSDLDSGICCKYSARPTNSICEWINVIAR